MLKPSEGQPLEFQVDQDGRLDRLVAEATGSGRRRVQSLVREGLVLVDGQRGVAGRRVSKGQRILVFPPAEVSKDQVFGSTPRIVLETEDLFVLNKPAGMHCEQGKREPSVATFLRGLDQAAATFGERKAEAGLVHRLDCDTSGVLLAARSRESYTRLRAAFHSHRVAKHYLALVAGRAKPAFEIDTALERRGPKVVVAPSEESGLEARTSIETLEAGTDWALVVAKTCTGAPHQVRAHLALCGHPLVGDRLYGGPQGLVSAQGHCLHAWRLQLGDELNVAVPLGGPMLQELSARRLRRGRSEAEG